MELDFYKNVKKMFAPHGLISTNVDVFPDRRGQLVVTSIFEELASLIPAEYEFFPHQTIHSITHPNGIRGYHAEENCHKLTLVTQGEGYAHFMELRDVRTFGMIETFSLTPGTAFFIPTGIGNSFESTGDQDLHYIYAMSRRSRSGVTEPSIAPFDPAFTHHWETSPTVALLGDRDMTTPPVTDKNNYFHERAKKHGLI